MRLIFVFVFPLFFPLFTPQIHIYMYAETYTMSYWFTFVNVPHSGPLLSASCYFFFFNLQKFHWLLIFLCWDHCPLFFHSLSSSVPTTLSERLSKTSDYLHYPHDKNFLKFCLTFRISPKLKALCLDLAPKYLSKFMTRWGGGVKKFYILYT